ncbi:MAG: hypothetical protein K6E10_11280 [Eubacterium sp.]|nr:hypothetical protein [Eubacterium sp.]
MEYKDNRDDKSFNYANSNMTYNPDSKLNNDPNNSNSNMTYNPDNNENNTNSNTTYNTDNSINNGPQVNKDTVYPNNNFAAGMSPDPNLLNNANYNNRTPVNANNSLEGKNSKLSVWALILSILGCTFIIGAILAIIDLTYKDGRKKVVSIIALCIVGGWLVLFAGNKIKNSSREKAEMAEQVNTVESVNDTTEAQDQALIEAATESASQATTEAATESVSQVTTESVSQVTTESATEAASETSTETVAETDLSKKDYKDFTDEEILSYERTSIMADGFNPETNIVSNLLGYQISTSNIIGQVDGSDDTVIYFDIDEKPGEFAFVYYSIKEYTNKFEDREAMYQSFADEFGILSYETEDKVIGGFNAFEMRGRFRTHVNNDTENGDTNNVKAGDCVVDVVYDEANSKVIFLILFETLRTEYDYYDEFEKTCASLVVAESTGISEDFKAMMDSYEEFMDQYIEFMTEYNNNPTDTELLGQYFDMLTKYTEYAQAITELEESEMTDEEAAYYLEVTTRVSKKLLNASLSD